MFLDHLLLEYYCQYAYRIQYRLYHHVAFAGATVHQLPRQRHSVPHAVQIEKVFR